MATNEEIMQRWIKGGFDDNYRPHWKNVGYEGNKFFSYRTCIAQVNLDNQGNLVALVSDNSFSATTAKQLSYLRFHLRDAGIKLIEVPCIYEERSIKIFSSIEIMFGQLEAIERNYNLTRMVCRQAYIAIVNNLEALEAHFNCLTQPQTILLRQCRKMADRLMQDDYVKALKAEARKARQAA